MSNANKIAEARPSSTVALARDSDDGVELYLVRQRSVHAFADAYMFPGGVVEHDDRRTQLRCRGIDAAAASRLLDVKANALDYFVAAIRELFEETGVLLASWHGASEELETARERLNDASLGWRRFADAFDIRMHGDALHYFSHWITPDAVPKRYSTRFFVARLPADQEARYDERELTDGIWMTANSAIERCRAGKLKLHFPTVKTLQALAGLPDVDAMIRWADRRAAAGVAAIHPRLPAGDPRHLSVDEILEHPV